LVFSRADFCAAIGYGPVDVTVMGLLGDCRYFYGTDTIKIINCNLTHLVGLASYWLETDCAKPDWCSGFDLNQDSVVDFADFALLSGRFTQAQAFP